jgi:hypothetical protein
MSTELPPVRARNAGDRDPEVGTEPQARSAHVEDDRRQEQARGKVQDLEEQRVRKPGELWRIEGSVSAVRAEIAQLRSLDDEAVRARIAELERRWRAELVAVLPESVLPELHEYFDWLGEVPPRVSELRIGLAQLEGWLDGIIVGLGVSISTQVPGDRGPDGKGPS